MTKWLEGDNGWAISMELFQWITTNIKKGSTILELGSGLGTKFLDESGYNMISIEHNEEYMNKYNSKYIYAPIFEGWYWVEGLQELKDLEYDLILVDGPPKATGGRAGLLKHLDLFKPVPMIFDDLQRDDEMNLYKEACQIFSCEEKIVGTDKLFGLINF